MSIDDILVGRSAAEVLREYVEASVGRTNADAAEWFLERFPRASSGVIQVIWNLRTSASAFGVEDDVINQAIEHDLREAGYLD